MENPMTKRFWTLLLTAALATGTAACNDNAEDHANEAADARQDAAEEMREGDTADAREDMQDAARHDTAAAVDNAQGDSTEGPN
jgi:Tfp pilus assembly protein PilF